MQKVILIAIGIAFFLQLTFAGVIRRSMATDEAKANFEREARIETESLLNKLFRDQIDFFAKVKATIPANTKRSGDIGKFIARMHEAIGESDVKEKDRMWRDTFAEFNQSPLLLNKESETNLTNEAYERILDESGMKDLVHTFLTEVATYFWKMARASGKVVEATIDEQLNELKNLSTDNFSFFL